MALRKVPGALALGLLASLAAHAALYGGDHAMGGSYHALLVQLGFVGAFSLAALLMALACGESRSAADGSILAARLRERLPNWSIGPAAILWFVAAEAIEPHHAGAPAIIAIVILVLISCLIAWLARILTAALAVAVLGIARPAFAPRTPWWRRRPQSRPLTRRPRFDRRRFARPPPITIALSRA